MWSDSKSIIKAIASEAQRTLLSDTDIPKCTLLRNGRRDWNAVIDLPYLKESKPQDVFALCSELNEGNYLDGCFDHFERSGVATIDVDGEMIHRCVISRYVVDKLQRTATRFFDTAVEYLTGPLKPDVSKTTNTYVPKECPGIQMVGRQYCI